MDDKHNDAEDCFDAKDREALERAKKKYPDHPGPWVKDHKTGEYFPLKMGRKK